MTRVAAWVKPFCSWKKGVNPAYCWEPVIWRGGRRHSARPDGYKVRDYVSASATTREGLPGAKPEAFCLWVFALLGLTPEDTLTDLFPGTGAVARAWALFRACPSLARLS